MQNEYGFLFKNKIISTAFIKFSNWFIYNFQISLKAEMEVAMKLLEKDIHEKQDTIISLRRQLDDIKLINLEMYKKLQVSIF